MSNEIQTQKMTPEQQKEFNQKVDTLDKTILQECLDTRTVLDGKQYKYINNKPYEICRSNDYFCYHVIPHDFNNKLFLDKDLLKQYLISLNPAFEFKKLSELAQHLIDTNIIQSVIITVHPDKTH